ncbi:MAG: hypothetical protein ACLRZH_06915 [Ruthenibacterium lactatiformans]
MACTAMRLIYTPGCVHSLMWIHGGIPSGQSMGGYVAASIAPRLRPHGLILMCPGAGMWYGCAGGPIE